MFPDFLKEYLPIILSLLLLIVIGLFWVYIKLLSVFVGGGIIITAVIIKRLDRKYSQVT